MREVAVGYMTTPIQTIDSWISWIRYSWSPAVI